MKVSKVAKHTNAKKGEILGVTVQIGTKERNTKAPVFADKYRKDILTYYLVKNVDDQQNEMILVDLKTKEEFTINHQEWRGTTASLFAVIKNKIAAKAEKMEIRSYKRNADYSQDPDRTSATISIYPSFVVTSLGNSTMNDDGTFTFSLDDVEGICLDKMAVHKEKFYLNRYF